MAASNVLGWAALIVTIIYTCVGLPVQIHKNHSTKSTAGLSLFMVIMLLCTFAVWLAYGLSSRPRNWFIVGSNFPGAIFILIILWQFWIYRGALRGQRLL
jgi:uncharacterized protein with PQ loop repeat